MGLKELKLPFSSRLSVLGLGAQRKNTVSFARGTAVYLSPIHPDLERLEDLLNFEQAAKSLLKKNPQVIAHDLHPEYQSTKFAFSLSKVYKLAAVQHHHAHIAACMAENSLKNQNVIGVAFDGTGLGTDNTLWGAEFLICNYKSFTRQAHLKEIPLLGSEEAIRQPGRVAALWLYLAFKDEFLNLKIDFIKQMDKKKWEGLKKVYFSGFNSPLTSSMGRLFDAVASIVSAKYKANFEAELAIELEKMAICAQGKPFAYNFGIIKKKEGYILDPLPIFSEIAKDLERGEPKEKIAYRFHYTVAQMILKTCVALRKKTGIKRVVLSGGVFQNKLLLHLSPELLYKDGFEVFTHQLLPCNDACVSVGQVAIASFRG